MSSNHHIPIAFNPGWLLAWDCPAWLSINMNAQGIRDVSAKNRPPRLVPPDGQEAPSHTKGRPSSWPQAVRAIGAGGLHFHDLRHTGNHFAAASGAGLKDLTARMGHDSERAAIIYQHEAQGADLAITSGIGAHIEAAKPGPSPDGDGSPGTHGSSANRPSMAHGGQPGTTETGGHGEHGC
jgi:hypothetical protein